MSDTQTQRDLLDLLRPLAAASEARRHACLRGTEVSEAERKLLDRLATEGSQTVPALALSLGTSRQYVQQVVDDCLAKALLTRRRNPRHARSKLIVLTSKGAALISQIREEEEALLRQMSARVTPEDIDTALSVLQHMLSSLRQSA